jgi:hypothetical protein
VPQPTFRVSLPPAQTTSMPAVNLRVIFHPSPTPLPEAGERAQHLCIR